MGAVELAEIRIEAADLQVEVQLDPPHCREPIFRVSRKRPCSTSGGSRCDSSSQVSDHSYTPAWVIRSSPRPAPVLLKWSTTRRLAPAWTMGVDREASSSPRSSRRV